MSKRNKGNESSLKTNYKGSKEHGGRVRTMLARLSAQDLKGIKVVIRRPYLPDLPTSTPPIIETSLDDPTGLIIHRAGEGKRPIFEREDLIVNVEEHLEERIVSTSPVRNENDRFSRRPHSVSRSDREHSKESYKRSYSRSPSTESRSSKNTVNKLKADVSKSGYKHYSNSGSSDFPRRDSLRKDSYHRELSPKPSTSKKKSKTPERRGHPYGDSPKRYERNHSRSHSPKQPYNKPSIHKYSRQHSKSPTARRRSRSPYTRKLSVSPYSKRRSRSPPSRKTPVRDTPLSVSSKSTRRSRSPDDRNRKHSHYSSYKRRSPSPYYRKRSRSPYRPRKRSVTPPRRDSRRPRSKSPRHSKHSSSTELAEYDESHADFGYYGAEAFWYPDPMLRPRFLPRGMIPPPVGLGRGMFRPPPYLLRPYLHIPHPSFRPRGPTGVFRPPRQKTPSTVVTTASSTENPTVSTATSSNVVIEECDAEPEIVDSNVSTEH